MTWRVRFWARSPRAAESSGDPPQRRRSHRLPLALPFAWRTAEPSTPGAADAHWNSSVTHDLSAGGLAFVAAGPELGQLLQLRLPLPDGEIAVSGEVSRVEELGDATRIRGENLVGVRFTDLSPRAEQQLVRYIFRVESSRHQLQKGDA